MSRRYETEATLEIGDSELDLPVRAYVEVEPSRSRGFSASLDGDLEVFVRGAWVPAEESGASLDTRVRAADALCDLALEDDSEGDY